MSILLIGSMSQKNSQFVEALYYITLMERLLRQFYFSWGGEGAKEIYERREAPG